MRFLAYALALAACGTGSARELPRLLDTAGVDPFVLERIEEALAACERGEARAELELAKIYDANGLNELALETYELCLAEADGANAGERIRLVYLRALVLEALGRAQEALAGFDETLALGDEYGPTHWRRGQLLLDTGGIAEARAAFERALALEPHSIPAELGLARVRLLENDAPGAIALLEPLAERSPDERFVHGLLARALRAVGDTARAEAELKREERAETLSIADPRAAEVRTRATGILVGLRRANELVASGESAKAVELLEKLHARAPEDLAVIQMLGKALVAAGENVRAIELLEAGLARHPRQFKLELFLGLAFTGQKANKKALDHLRLAYELNPAYGPTLAALGETQTKFGQFAEAERTLARALEAGEDELRTRVLLIQVQLEQQAWERALASAEAACARYPNAAAAWAYLAEARVRAGDQAGARAALAEAEQRNPAYERLATLRALLANGTAAR